MLNMWESVKLINYVTIYRRFIGKKLCHDIKTFSTLLALYVGSSLLTGEFLHIRANYFDAMLNIVFIIVAGHLRLHVAHVMSLYCHCLYIISRNFCYMGVYQICGFRNNPLLPIHMWLEKIHVIMAWNELVSPCGGNPSVTRGLLQEKPLICWCFLWFCFVQTVEETLKLPVPWNTMTFM